MSRSFSLVDSKVAEAAFFLEKIADCGYETLEMRCYLSAFVSAARTVTFSLQSVLRNVDGFDEWYRSHQQALKAHEVEIEPADIVREVGLFAERSDISEETVLPRRPWKSETRLLV